MPIIRQHKSLLLSGITTLATAALLSGCASDPLPMPDSELYTRDFIKAFGTFDQSHDWNYATRTSVTVNAGTYTEVKVLADYDGKRYCFATFTDVKGRHTLNVDIPKGVTDLIVSANGRNYPVKAGGEISIDGRGTRTFGTPVEGQPVTFAPTANKKEFPAEIIREYIEALPEDNINADAIIESTGKKIITNFYFVSDGNPVTLYPLYWNTDSYHALGVYWLNDEGRLDTDCMVDIYYTRSGELKWWKKGDPKGGEDGYLMVRDDLWHYEYGCQGCQRFGTESIYTVSEENPFVQEYYNDGIREIVTSTHQTKPTEGGPTQFHKGYRKSNNPVVPRDLTSPEAYDITEAESAVTKGVTLTFQAGVKYGFYLKVNTNNTLNPTEAETQGIHHLVFSQAIRNQQFGTPLGANPKPGQFTVQDQAHIHAHKWSEYITTGFDPADDYAQAAYSVIPVEIDGVTKNYAIFSFDDWKQSDKKNPDLNDLVFIFDDEFAPSEVVDEDEPVVEEWEWIIACEDLGTNDFDFNDVVFSVSNPTTAGESGKKTVTIKALASGGTLPVYVKYNGTELKPEGNSSAEFHSWFGDYSSNTVINASGTRADGKSVTIEVPADFTMSCTDRVDEGSGNMGGFSVEVHYPARVKSITATNPNFNESTMSPDLIGTAPQMICVPADWCWPVENKFILEVYNKFKDWCNSQTDNHWHSEDNRAPSGYWKR